MAIVDFDNATAVGVAGVNGAGIIATNSPFLDENQQCETSGGADVLDTSPGNLDRPRMASMGGLHVSVVKAPPPPRLSPS